MAENIQYEKLFYDRFDHFVRRQKISYRKLSGLLGMNETYFTNMKRRHGFPSMDVFFRICDFFKVTPDEFFNIKVDDPEETKRLNEAFNSLWPAQREHILAIVEDLAKNKK